MKVLMLYRQRSESAKRLEEYAKDFSRVHPNKRVDLLDVDSREGASTAGLYDVVEYPAVLALRDDGQLMKHWQGNSLPLMDELAYYVSQ